MYPAPSYAPSRQNIGLHEFERESDMGVGVHVRDRSTDVKRARFVVLLVWIRMEIGEIPRAIAASCPGRQHFE